MSGLLFHQRAVGALHGALQGREAIQPPPAPRKSRDPTWTLSCKMLCCVVHHVAQHSRHLYATHVCAVAAKGGWIWEHKFEVDSGAYFFNLVSAH